MSSISIEKSLKIIIAFVCSGLLISCGATQPDAGRSYNLSYVDDYIIPQDETVEDETIGGLSGLIYDGDDFYTIVDSPAQSRFLKISTQFSGRKIHDVSITKAIPLAKDSVYPDWEAIGYRGKNSFLITSEGSIQNQKMAGIIEVDSTGKIHKNFDLPSYFTMDNARNNRMFESLVTDKNGGFWTTTETPLKNEGSKPGFFKNSAQVRLLHFTESGNINKEQFYALDRLRRLPFLPYAMNGVSSIEKIDDKLLVLERAFYAGRGRKNFRCRLFETTLPQKEVTRARSNPKKVPGASKKLLLDFESIRKKLKHKLIDNLEGMCLGPELPNGHRTLWFVADNNFNSFQQQYNQIIVLEIEPHN